jgi:pyruvate/2-oxoglutarate dehydrogenase complex dihydrolipoamide dehydrogenase (E3) component
MASRTVTGTSRPARIAALGIHPHADEVINLFGLAIRRDLTVDDLKSMMFAYPTGASNIGYML